MYKSKVEQLVENSKPVTLDAIESDLNNNCWDALYFATEEQISSLIDSGKIDEDFYSRHQDYQEEMRCLRAEAQAEFS
jgi:hypothetical protein